MSTPSVACIGTSAGGITAIQKLLSHLPKTFQTPLVIAQHVAGDTDWSLELVFGSYFSGRVVEALDKMPIEAANAYFAPPGYHLMIERDFSFSLTQEEPVHFARPAIDVLFESAAWALGSSAIGIVLTGANADGAEGLLRIKESGGITIVQDPSEAEFPFMPRAALLRAQPQHTYSLEQIADFLSRREVGNE